MRVFCVRADNNQTLMVDQGYYTLSPDIFFFEGGKAIIRNKQEVCRLAEGAHNFDEKTDRHTFRTFGSEFGSYFPVPRICAGV